jgi:hypothetical protein
LVVEATDYPPHVSLPTVNVLRLRSCVLEF